MLQQIMGLLPVEQLLSLRLVCRRWSESVLGWNVWQHRRLRSKALSTSNNLPRSEAVNNGLLNIILLRAPALESVCLTGDSQAPWVALANGVCKVNKVAMSFRLFEHKLKIQKIFQLKS